LANRHTWLLALGVVVVGCSDATSPPPNAFQAQLTGARTGGVSGVAIAERSFTEQFPDLHFVIRMPASRGDTLATIGIRCLGDQPPVPGSHTIDLAGQECVATYSRVLLSSQPVVIERADAAMGTLAIDPATPAQTAGTFTFSGTMLVDGDSVGVVRVSGRFSAALM
jgi:hypothetical protein